MRELMMSVEMRRCWNALSANALVKDSMFRNFNSSNVIKNSSSDSNSISLTSVSKAELIVNSSKNWVTYSSFESLMMLSQSTMYWFNRRSNLWRILHSRWRSENLFFEFFRFFSEWLIDQQSDFSHTKHFVKRRAWNLSFLSRKSSRRLNDDFSRRYCLSMKY
jgi:hypothetical protein